MDERSLAMSFNDSLTSDVSDCVGELVEVGIDSIMDDSLLKDVPFISTTVSIYRIGKSVRERHHIKKLVAFLNEIGNNTADDEKRQKYREKFQINDKFRNQELEYIMVLIDKYIGFEKPQMIAKLYLAYLDGKIDWITLTKYVEVVDRFLPGVIVVLCSSEHFKTIRDEDTDTLQRLIALGLVIEEIRKSNVQEDGKGAVIIDAPEVMELRKRSYKRTCFGEVLVKIISN